MKLRSKSDSSILGFITSEGTLPKVALLLLVGVLLIVIGSINFEEEKTVSEEERIAEICSAGEGVGECRVMVTYSDDGESVYAVAVLCEGADSVEVRKRVSGMICSLYGIGAHRVSVMKLSE